MVLTDSLVFEDDLLDCLDVVLGEYLRGQVEEGLRGLGLLMIGWIDDIVIDQNLFRNHLHNISHFIFTTASLSLLIIITLPPYFITFHPFIKQQIRILDLNILPIPGTKRLLFQRPNIKLSHLLIVELKPSTILLLYE